MNDRKREGLRITLKIFFPSNWKDGVALFRDGEDKKEQVSGEDKNFKVEHVEFKMSTKRSGGDRKQD